MIHHGDCLDVMASMEPESIDAIVTDPPYGLGFMGKAWDHGAPGVPFWEAMLRVAKPSAYLLAFGGTRTVHRIATSIEDAGWIIRDMLVWAYASGFPKSKASLKPAWEPIVMARKPGPLRMLAIDECRIGTTVETWPASRGYSRHDPGSPVKVTQDTGDAPLGRWPANLLLTDPIFDGDTPGVVGGGESGTMPGSYRRAGGDWEVTSYAGSPPGSWHNGYGDSGTYSRFFELPEGDGCYLCGRARSVDASSSPRNGHGVSAPGHAPTRASAGSAIAMDSPSTNGIETPSWLDAEPSTTRTRPSRGSRPDVRSLSPDPANNAARLGTSSATTTTTPDRWTCDTCAAVVMRSYMDAPGFAESPDAPRFLIVPKADRAEREPLVPGNTIERVISVWGGDEDDLTPGKKSTIPRRNTHPTVKPIDLMRHLVRLVTPPGGVVLDPFLGSGTTALAAEMEGFEWVGIEREAEYVAIAEARLNGTQRGIGL